MTAGVALAALPGPADPRRGFLRDVVSTIAGNLASPVIGIATSPVLAHALGVQGRGEFAAATSPTLLLTLAGTVGLPEAATYLVAGARVHTRAALTTVVWISLLTGGLLAAGVSLLAPALTSGEPQVTRLIAYGAGSLPLVLAVGAVRGAAAGRGRWRLVNAEKYLGNGLRLGLVLAFAVPHLLDLPTAVALYLGCPVAAGLVYLPFVRSVRRERAPLATAGVGRLLLRYGCASWVGGVAGVVLGRLDQVLIAPLAGARELGLYAAAVAVAEIPYVVSGATRDVVAAADAAGRDDGRAARAVRLTVLTTAVLAGALAALAPLLVHLGFGTAFAGATPMVQVLLLAAVLYAPGSTAGALLLARGRPGLRSAGLALACLLNVALLPVLVPRYGGLGAAWASVAGYGLFSVCATVAVHRVAGLPPRSLLLPRAADLREVMAVLRRPARPS